VTFESTISSPRPAFVRVITSSFVSGFGAFEEPGGGVRSFGELLVTSSLEAIVPLTTSKVVKKW